MSLATAVGRFIPDFMTVKQYESQKKEVFHTLKEIGPATRREIAAETPSNVMPSAVSARLAELEDNGKVVKVGERVCSEADHNKRVNAYEVTISGVLTGVE